MRISDWSSDVCSSDLIGQVHRDELPRDVLRGLVGQEMDALDDHVVREHQPFEQRRIVSEPARRGVGRDVAQAGDEIGFVHWEIVMDSAMRSEEHTSELQSLMRISYAVFCLKKKQIKQ